MYDRSGETFAHHFVPFLPLSVVVIVAAAATIIKIIILNQRRIQKKDIERGSKSKRYNFALLKV